MTEALLLDAAGEEARGRDGDFDFAGEAARAGDFDFAGEAARERAGDFAGEAARERAGDFAARRGEAAAALGGIVCVVRGRKAIGEETRNVCRGA